LIFKCFHVLLKLFLFNNEVFENQVEVDAKVKTEPDMFEDEDKKPMEDKVDVEKVKTESEESKLQIWF
jgi:hypothetical protein